MGIMRMRIYLQLLAFAFFATCLSLPLHGQQTVGLFQNDAGTTDGYTFFAALGSTKSYLIDNCGRKVHEWPSSYSVGVSARLLENGLLLHPGYVANAAFPQPGLGGRVELIDWAGNVTWHYTVSSATEAAHHDVIPMPNGNVLITVWEKKDSLEAVAQGRNPATLGASLWPDKLIEVQPTTPGNGNIVWEWHTWDHLVQDFDSTKPNFGVVADHPELINLNYYDPTSEVNWMHCNGIAYNATLDQIAVSSHRFDEIWLIDHSTTTAQAASHSGGNLGKGGDLLYRYGNPQTYNRGTVADQKFFGQHNIDWVPDGDMYAGMLQVFNNGNGRPAGPYSTLEIFAPETDNGNYVLNPGQPYGPAAPTWTYQDIPNFYSQIISGFQRLPGNHTLVCEGATGTIFEMDSLQNTLWSYVNPVVPAGPLNQGDSVFNNNIFRAYRYLPNYPGLAGQTLTPGDRIEGNPLPLPANCLSSSEDGGSMAVGFEVAPNPFCGSLSVMRPKSTPTELSIVDQQGRTLLRQRISAREVAISTTDLPAGLYYLRLQGESTAIKLVKVQD